MLNRAVTAFRKSVIKSKSSTTISNSDRDENEDRCDESIISNSLPVASHDAEVPSASASHLLKRKRRSQNFDQEGDDIFFFI